MWFKNLICLRFTEKPDYTPSELEQQLAALPFQPCGAHEPVSIGWSAPLGRNAHALTHAGNGFIMLCAQKEEKVLPAAVINELTQERIEEEEIKQGRKLPKKERTALKDEIIFECLPKAFVFSRRLYAYLDTRNGWLVIDAASPKKAEELTSLLRKTLGSLPVVFPTTRDAPASVMTRWVLGEDLPSDWTLEDECELRATDEEGGIVRCKRHDLGLPEIRNHIDHGKQVVKLAATWSDRLSFVIDETLAIKRLRFLDLVQQQLDSSNQEDEAARFDAEFSLMTLELEQFLPRLMDVFGGEAQE